MATLIETLLEKTKANSLRWWVKTESTAAGGITHKAVAEVSEFGIHLLNFYDSPSLEIVGPTRVKDHILATAPDLITLRDLIVSEMMADFMKKLVNL